MTPAHVPLSPSNETTCLATGKTVVSGGTWVDTNGDNDTDAGEFVDYLLLVENVGTVTLESIVLTDGSAASEDISCVPSIPDSLMPGEGFECQATYTVSEAWSAAIAVGRREVKNVRKSPE